MTARRGGRGDTAGSTTVEFALTAMAMLLLVMGILGTGVMLWSWQVLEGAAIDAARCAGLNAASCKNAATAPANTAAYAARAAGSRGLTALVAADATVRTGSAARTACGGTTASVVSVTLAYSFGRIFPVPLQAELVATACYPLSSG